MKREYHFRLKIKELIEERQMTLTELSQLSGVRLASLSEMANNTRTVINKAHLGMIMEALDITDINDILELKIDIEF